MQLFSWYNLHGVYHYGGGCPHESEVVRMENISIYVSILSLIVSSISLGTILTNKK